MTQPVAEDMAQAEGPNASLQFGEATQMNDLMRQSGMLAQPGARIRPGSPPAQQVPTPAPGPGNPSPPVQPSSQKSGPPGAGGQRPNMSAIFRPEPQQYEPWRQRLAVWAKRGGPALRKLHEHANGG